ncbi:MAG: alpha-amylase, partial [Candidatus Aureabacteria bacterium]|nr:alpha-amylase [Candidatus Auribacterota bacterium]
MDKNKIRFLYEINTRVFFRELSFTLGKKITFENFPDKEIDRITSSGFDAVWFMGVWKQSKKSLSLARKNPLLRKEVLNVLPDAEDKDITGSCYSIAGYDIDQSLGTREGLFKLKKRMNQKGLKVILDFVPNHLALDHPWVAKKPDLFINGTMEDYKEHPKFFFKTKEKKILGLGKDPFFPAWIDVAQLNYFNPETRKLMTEELLDIAGLCDGVRCDMAMLVLKRFQKRIWGHRVFGKDRRFKEPKEDFWNNAIRRVKKHYRNFIFIAEVYWKIENELLESGFDYTYDKDFYEALQYEKISEIKASFKDADTHLRFIENHDERRAMEIFGEERSMAAALLTALSPGPMLIYQGQTEGMTKRMPVQLLRTPPEDLNIKLQLFYETLLSTLKGQIPENIRWNIIKPVSAWENNLSYEKFVILCSERKEKIFLGAVNYS